MPSSRRDKRAKTVRVFVYGTLKRGYQNNMHYLFGKSAMLGQHTTKPHYTLKDLGYYPAVELCGTTAVKGEVYQIADDVLQELDWLEGYPAFYERELIDTEYGPSWMYYLSPARMDNTYKVIESGEWT